jgi:hypothetical protein
VKLVILYALRYERFAGNETNNLIALLERSGLGSSLSQVFLYFCAKS